jgi:hypothetical protein
MRRIERPSIATRTVHDAAALLALDLAIMVRLAHRLPVLAIPEQLEVALVWYAVVNDSGGHRSALHVAADAQRVSVKEGQAGLLPLAAISTL